MTPEQLEEISKSKNKQEGSTVLREDKINAEQYEVEKDGKDADTQRLYMAARLAARQSENSEFFPWLAKITTNYINKTSTHCNGVLLNSRKNDFLSYE